MGWCKGEGGVEGVLYRPTTALLSRAPTINPRKGGGGDEIKDDNILYNNLTSFKNLRREVMTKGKTNPRQVQGK